MILSPLLVFCNCILLKISVDNNFYPIPNSKTELITIANKEILLDLSLGVSVLSFPIFLKLEFADFFQCRIFLTLFRMGPFRLLRDGGVGGLVGEKGSIPKICRTYPTIMKLGTVIPYLKKTEKIYESCDTNIEFCRQ